MFNSDTFENLLVIVTIDSELEDFVRVRVHITGETQPDGSRTTVFTKRTLDFIDDLFQTDVFDWFLVDNWIDEGIERRKQDELLKEAVSWQGR